MNQAIFYDLGEYQIIMPLEHTKIEQIEAIQAFEEQKEDYPILSTNRTYKDKLIEDLDRDELCEIANKVNKKYYPSEILEEINQIIDGNGVESLSEEYGKIHILTYVNMGDVYDETICYDPAESEFIVSDWGSFYEEWESEQSETNMDKIKKHFDSELKSIENEFEIQLGMGLFTVFTKESEKFPEIVEPSIKIFETWIFNQQNHTMDKYINKPKIEIKRPEITFEEFDDYYIIFENNNGYNDYFTTNKKDLWINIRSRIWDNNENGHSELELW